MHELRAEKRSCSERCFVDVSWLLRQHIDRECWVQLEVAQALSDNSGRPSKSIENTGSPEKYVAQPLVEDATEVLQRRVYFLCPHLRLAL